MKKYGFYWETAPIADKENTVCGSKYRFTVLTSRLIRMEYSNEGVFCDRASQTVFFRNFPKTDYSIKEENSVLFIETEYLCLEYKINSNFTPETLAVKLKDEPKSQWRFSEDFEDLGGTASTLDGINGSVPLVRGVCSRNGFSVLDDSKSLLLDGEKTVSLRNSGTYDAYFFGYGFDYSAAVKDLYRLTGAPEMLPKFALGNWWSRYHKYTQQEYMDLTERFAAEKIPFSVAVIDMDWHITSIPDELKDTDTQLIECGPEGWTGYSWNKELFPDYKQFLNFLHKNNLKTALNLHPAQGVRKHEVMYRQAALAEGIDPNKEKRVPFNILSAKAMRNYFDILLHPYEEDGVDFWWMDWQQGTDYRWIHQKNENGKLKDERELLDPLWMLNHMHVADIRRNGKRPMYFSRYSGAGSHRYSIGFSGDTMVTWQSLDFQPYFTATASNIGYCWWSHDIGGHFLGYSDNELTTRWMQLGVFSPINRLHSCNSYFQGKEPWNYAPMYESVMKRYLNLRYELIPYLYTMNYRVQSRLEPLIRPMYYSHPKCSGAYEVKNQFWFGNELIVAPITEPVNGIDKLGKAAVWFPAGKWFDFFDGTMYDSRKGRKTDVFRSIEDYPVFAKSGAIIPMMQTNGNCLDNPEALNICVFPGDDNVFTLYEDEGEYDNYKNGAFVTTKFEQRFNDNNIRFSIYPAKGDLSLIPGKRIWNIKFKGISNNTQISVFADGRPAEADILCGDCVTAVKIRSGVNQKIIIDIKSDSIFTDNAHSSEKCFKILQRSDIRFESKSILLECVNNKWWNCHKKIKQIYSEIPEHYHLACALKEQLTLTCDEFDQ